MTDRKELSERIKSEFSKITSLSGMKVSELYSMIGLSMPAYYSWQADPNSKGFRNMKVEDLVKVVSFNDELKTKMDISLIPSGRPFNYVHIIEGEIHSKSERSLLENRIDLIALVLKLSKSVTKQEFIYSVKASISDEALRSMLITEYNGTDK